jgi:hypothetical protein
MKNSLTSAGFLALTLFSAFLAAQNANPSPGDGPPPMNVVVSNTPVPLIASAPFPITTSAPSPVTIVSPPSAPVPHKASSIGFGKDALA